MAKLFSLRSTPHHLFGWLLWLSVLSVTCLMLLRGSGQSSTAYSAFTLRNISATSWKTCHVASRSSSIDVTPYINFLPHLKVGKGIRNVDPQLLLAAAPNFYRTPPIFIISIPTVPRNDSFYVMNTIAGLMVNLYPQEYHKVKFVVMCGSREERDDVYCNSLADSLSAKYDEAIENGMLELIQPPKEWYPPNLDSLTPTLNDTQSRMTWRTKQHYDFLYAMIYTLQRDSDAIYYLQLEDDLVTIKGYLSVIIDFIRKSNTKQWLGLDFTQLGFIGKLFRLRTVSEFVQFDVPRITSQPIDWVLDLMFERRFCNNTENKKACWRKMRMHRLSQRPPVFNHIGRESSLTGKIQLAREKSFRQRVHPLSVEPEPVPMTVQVVTLNGNSTTTNNSFPILCELSTTGTWLVFKMVSPIQVSYLDISVQFEEDGVPTTSPLDVVLNNAITVPLGLCGRLTLSDQFVEEVRLNLVRPVRGLQLKSFEVWPWKPSMFPPVWSDTDK